MNNATTKVRGNLDSRRERAATVLGKASDMVRERSHQAAELIDKGGSKAADVLHGSAERVQPKRGFVRSHPKRSALFAAFALITALVAVLIIRGQLSADDDDRDL